jgi:DNA-binding transcriptional regulator YiaG
MPNNQTTRERIESTHVAGELAASRLFSLIHERFFELQKKEALTQAEIARRLGVSEQAVSRWLVEPRDMRVRSAGRLLAALEGHLLFSIDRFEDIRRGNNAHSRNSETISVEVVSGAQRTSLGSAVSSAEVFTKPQAAIAHG